MQVPSLADWTPCGSRPEIREAEAGGPARTPHARFRALSNLTHDCSCACSGTLPRARSGRQPSFLPVTAAAAAAIEGCQCQWRDMEG